MSEEVPLPTISGNVVVNVAVKVHDRSKSSMAETPTSSGIANALTNGILRQVYKRPTALVVCPDVVLEVDITNLVIAGPDSVIQHVRSLIRDHDGVSYAFMVAMPESIHVFGQTRGQIHHVNMITHENDEVVVTSQHFKLPESWDMFPESEIVQVPGVVLA